jgi:raffinose synthase
MSADVPYRLQDGLLKLGERVLLAGVDKRLSLEPEPMSCGAMIRFADEPRARHRIALGGIAHLVAFTALNRTSPFWMVPTAGRTGSAVPCETQWMLAELADGSCLLLAPVVAERRRWTLETESGKLSLNGSANDNDVLESEGPALFVAHGRDPYELMPRAAAALARRMGWKVRAERGRPPIGDGLGWCTFNAYYADISHDKIRAALASMKSAGIPLRWLLIDGGWQTNAVLSGGEKPVSAIAADPAKFPGGLAPTIAMAKREFGLGQVMVWHAMIGLPSGALEGSVPGVPMKLKSLTHPPAIYAVQPTIDEWFGPRISAPAAHDAYRFFQALHQYLRAEGTDAVKVDFQSTLEGICQGEGGRVAYDLAWREALERSVDEHFGGQLINCMSCSSECLYLGRGSALVRSSDDYYPNRPEMHGMHLHTNAQMGMWWGEFAQPDWDMFQSGHPYGGYHAAGRALSGGPLLITDEVGKHDAAVVRRLVLPDGRGLHGDLPGRPCPDTLYHDPTREPRALKIFNRIGASAVVGLFHANHGHQAAIDSSVSAADAPGLGDREVVALLHHAGRAVRLRPGASTPVRLSHAGHEVASIAPVEDGLALFGLGDRYNGAAAIGERESKGGALRFACAGGGPLTAWSERAPRRVEVDGATVEWRWDAATGLGRCELPPGAHRVAIER